MSYQLKHGLIDNQGNDLGAVLGVSQEAESLRRLIRLVFHNSETSDLQEALTSELYNVMNGIDLSLRSSDAEILARNLVTIHKYHSERLKFCNVDKYDKENQEHEALLKKVS
jgi:flagellin-specific chaperone FliS